ncbi:hypothetical protein AV274_5806 [Blastocystis sp. ATCC 50177/Nand II]|uniref:Uncharacterized protein n=1 Tax=Blastocystis sp. subtype 1 (strain ATCC 50177 / NandII) TaxID=478820 RepID=A0A196S8N7_BLAHN|nr:hypothetical protein AV274_5806 [Blastocystis sp. ATCC 50177/Nand II]
MLPNCCSEHPLDHCTKRVCGNLVETRELLRIPSHPHHALEWHLSAASYPRMLLLSESLPRFGPALLYSVSPSCLRESSVHGGGRAANARLPSAMCGGIPHGGLPNLRHWVHGADPPLPDHS